MASWTNASGLVCALGAMSACGRIGFEASTNGSDSGNPDTTSCAPVSGLLAYFPMNATDVAGAVVSDRSGHAVDGSIVGSPAPTISPGKVGDALDFTGLGGSVVYVDVPGIAFAASPGAAITVAMWLYRAASPAPDDSPIYVPMNPKYDLWLANGKLCINTGNSECWGFADGSLVDRWVHVAAVFSNGPETDSQLYVDGIARTSGCLTGACTSTRTVMAPLQLGGGDVYQWQGLLDEVRVYDHALSATEVQPVFDGSVCPP